MEKIFEIDDRTPFENRERYDRATMLRIFRTLIEDAGSKLDFLKIYLTKARDMAKIMVLKKFPISVISKISGLTEMEIKSL